MARLNIIGLYWVLSAVNGSVPALIALLFSVSGLGFLLIWASATLATFTLICLICLDSAPKEAAPESEDQWVKGEIQRLPFFH
jgi:hypothetical protein